LPLECKVIDAEGLEVYPGLVAASAGSIHGPGDPQDTTNVYGLNMVVALAGGITTALAESSAVKLTFGTTKDMVIRSNLYVPLNYSLHNPLDRAQLRTDLERVRTYLRDLRKYEREKVANKDAKPPAKDWIKDKFENYLKLLQREAVAVATAQTAQELRDVADLATVYGFHLVVRGAYEGWIVAPTLGRAGVRAIVTPRASEPPDDRSNRPSGASIENARILNEHGVTVAVVPPIPAITLWGLAGRDLLHLNMEAAFAVRGGLSNDDALRAITIDAARVLGVDERVGSLEVGKDADLVVCDGDLLHYMTQVRYTIVNGRVAYDKTKDTLFAHIRPTGQPAVPQFDDQWPRRLEWPRE
jgi:imidazolonepropionase-like amidohydrolase